MAKSRHFHLQSHDSSLIFQEWKDAFNAETYLDDQFTIPKHTVAYFGDGASWYRSLSSPFYLDDILHFGRLGQSKNHRKLKGFKVLIHASDTIYHDQWALDYLKKKAIRNFNQDVFGDYQFRISQGGILFQQLTSIGFDIEDVPYLAFITKLNDYLQHDFVRLASSATYQGQAVDLLKLEFAKVVQQRFEKWGLQMVDFQTNIVPSTR
jgi:hypothetical protein